MNEMLASRRTIQSVADDYRSLIADTLPIARALVRGREMMVEEGKEATGQNSRIAETWICTAHQGTLDKLERFFVGNGPFSDLEIVGNARNLFENLVWCRLFQIEIGYGLIFFEQFLREHIESTEAHIAKVDSEIALFEQLELTESKQIQELASQLKSQKITVDQFTEQLDRNSKSVDRRARLAFAIYGPMAEINGYGYQRHLLAQSVKPKLHENLLALQSQLASLQATLPSSSRTLMTAIGQAGRVNWRKAATLINLGHEYDYVYSFASKILHSKAISTVPNGHLNDLEAVLMFEYAYIAAERILDCVRNSPLPGIAEIAVINLDQEESVGPLVGSGQVLDAEAGKGE
jgi:hypothetical protein